MGGFLRGGGRVAAMASFTPQGVVLDVPLALGSDRIFRLSGSLAWL
ncbi:MAG: hypothetical protein H6Q38_3285 [Chloroflexi bacterium]|nr:hypothetical protein [Chloroflexota bacterium]